MSSQPCSTDFNVKGELGRGAFGIVHLVEDKVTRKQLARKQICMSKLSPDERTHTIEEVEVMMKINHEHVVAYKWHEETDEELFIYTEYCSGGDLEDLLKNMNSRSIPEKVIVCWLSQMADALRYLHSKRILHRDIKPPNIYLTENADIKLGDMGIARVMKPSESLVQTMAGTPVYMSPEVFSLKGYNEKTDIWSFGCIIYELATKGKAFGSNVLSLQQLIFQVVTDKTPSIPAPYSEGMRQLCCSMLRKDYGQRPSAEDIIRSELVTNYLREPCNPLMLLRDITTTSIVDDLLVSQRKLIPVDLKDTATYGHSYLSTIKETTSSLITIVKKGKKSKNKTTKSMPSFDQSSSTDSSASLNGVMLSMMSTLSVQDYTMGASSDIDKERKAAFLIEQIALFQRLCCEAIGERSLKRAYEVIESESDADQLQMKLKQILGVKFDEYYIYIMFLRLFEEMYITTTGHA